MPTLEAAPASTEVLQLEQTRIIKAPRARVYEAWTNPEMLKKWFGPANMHCPSASLDVRVGGSYRIECRADVRLTDEAMNAPQTPESEKGQTSATGVYTRVVPNELLKFSWIPSWQPGEKSIVTITFKDAPGGTELTLRHEHFLTEVSRDGHSKGWAGSFDKLAKTLEA